MLINAAGAAITTMPTKPRSTLLLTSRTHGDTNAIRLLETISLFLKLYKDYVPGDHADPGQ